MTINTTNSPLFPVFELPKPLVTTERAAEITPLEEHVGRRILTIFRNRRALIQLFKQDQKALYRMSHLKFKKLIKRIEKQASSLPPTLWNDFKSFIKELKAKRETHNSSFAIPVFTSTGMFSEEQVILPSYKLEKSYQLGELPPYMYYYQTEKTAEAFEKLPKQLPSLQKLNLVVQALSNSDLIPWEHAEEGCFARAEAASHLLTLIGVPRSHIFNQFALVPKEHAIARGIEKEEELFWTYHVAVSVKIDKELYVVDPSIDPYHCLTVPQWIRSQTKIELPTKNLGEKTSSVFRYDRTECTTFQAAQGMLISCKSEQGIRLMDCRENSTQFYRLLSSHWTALELGYLDHIDPRPIAEPEGSEAVQTNS